MMGSQNYFKYKYINLSFKVKTKNVIKLSNRSVVISVEENLIIQCGCKYSHIFNIFYQTNFILYWVNYTNLFVFLDIGNSKIEPTRPAWRISDTKQLLPSYMLQVECIILVSFIDWHKLCDGLCDHSLVGSSRLMSNSASWFSQ